MNHLFCRLNSSTVFAGSLLALGLTVAACSSDDTSGGNDGGTGGTSSTGGKSGTGGSSTGGKAATGGVTSTGGASATGGYKATGGSKATGGAEQDGGDASTGGATTDGGDGGPTDDGGPDACVPKETLTPPVNATIAVPAGVTPIHHFHATGDQVYTCTATTTGDTTTYSWILKAPDARLFDSCGTAVAKHYAGPTWESLADGSKVVGARLAGVTPDATAIPWLLLQGTPSGTGIFSAVTYVQRVETVAGLAPTTTCDAGYAGTDKPVAYSAEYYFFTGP
jgi:hypothetical protein